MISLANRYFFKNFVNSFISIFMTLFLLSSLTYLVSIANITSILKITHYDFMQLYIYVIPRVIIYTLPVTFFISVASSLSNMSKDNESIVLFTLGLKPAMISRFVFSMAFVVSFFTLINIVIYLPILEQFDKQFMAKKRAEASLNIQATEFGQQFGNWYIFVGNNKKLLGGAEGSKELEEVILFEQSSTEEKFILADHAYIANNKGTINLDLRDGNAFLIKDEELTKIEFAKMKMNDYSELEDFKNESILSYWKRVLQAKESQKEFIINLSIGIFPLVTFLIAISVGIFNRRYDKGLFSIYLFVTILIYFVLTYVLSTRISFWTILVVPLLYAIVSYFIYRKSILARY